MILLDRILSLENDDIRCACRYTDPGFFGCEDGVPICWALEIIAQACAAWVSIHARESGVTQGRLLKCRTFSLCQPHIPYNRNLIAQARRKLCGSSGIWIFEGSLNDEQGACYAHGELTLLVQ
jgi:predicted hotdog family 3-hydroxylacyl-ACP dehydratase